MYKRLTARELATSRWLALVAVVVVIAAAVVVLHHRATARVATPSPGDEIDRVVAEQLPSLRSESDLDRFLDDLEAQARRARRVTALEVEPGLRVIQRLDGVLPPGRAPEKMNEFVGRMARVSRELALNAGDQR